MPPTLAVGADLKNTCAVAEGRYAWLSQHIGDMDDLATLEAFGDSAGHLERLVGVHPEHLAADAHPAYRSAAWAARNAAGRPVRTVQHHHAHVAAVMAEHGLDGRQPVIGVAFDGTGYGTDGAVWGGEVLVADYKDFRRAAHLALRPAARRRRERAPAVPDGAGPPAPLPACPGTPTWRRSRPARQTSRPCSPTRWRPASAACRRPAWAGSSMPSRRSCGLRHVVDFEAQAAIELEGRARGVDVGGAGGYVFGVEAVPGRPAVADPAPVVRQVVEDLRRGVEVELVAARFHRAVADLVVVLAEQERAASGLSTVVLGGGVFGNALLLSAARRQLENVGFRC